MQSSASKLQSEGTYPAALIGDGGSQLDNFTDALMINTAATSSGNLLFDAAAAQRIESDIEDTDPIGDLAEMVVGDPGQYVEYSRYWHGYVLPLRLMLGLGLDYSVIRMINMLIFLVALGLLVWACARRKALIFLVPMLCFFGVTRFISVPYSLQYTGVMLITVSAVILLIILKLRSLKHVAILFSVIGIMTNYIDLLTMPLLTLGLPLLAYLFFLFGMVQSKTNNTSCYGFDFGVGVRLLCNVVCEMDHRLTGSGARSVRVCFRLGAL